MYTRSEVRQACFKAKSGSISESQLKIYDGVKSLFQAHHKIENFPKEWDVAVDRSGKIHLITPEIDRDFVTSVCAEARLKTQHKLPWEWNTREQNVIDIIETELLEGVTGWENYNQKWSVEIDIELKRIKTKLLNVTPSQTFPEPAIEVVKEVPPPLNFNVEKFTPMSASEQALFDEFLEKKKVRTE